MISVGRMPSDAEIEPVIKGYFKLKLKKQLTLTHVRQIIQCFEQHTVAEI